jgi:PhnB protein
VTDPFGHVWQIATHVEDLTSEEIEARGRELFASTS